MVSVTTRRQTPPTRIAVAPPAGVAPPQTNALELTVSELAGALKRTVEDRFGHVRVRGEISNYRGLHSSGHAYFSLKDANARLDAVIWRGTLAKLKTRPEEGLDVIATGRITTFPGKSAYQIVIEALEPAGVGALMALVEERRKRLLAEGLFDPDRKRPLPYLPEVIGVVTSPTGAVIRDILHRLQERFPRRVLVWPVRVQGESSAAEVAAAIAGFDALSREGVPPRPDVLIVARGGGSLEDLWGFNEEVVVRAAAGCTIPLVSAVGHETDTTLIDFVADLRAPTPTGAAEKCVPVRAELFAQLAALGHRRHSAKRRNLDRAGRDLRNLRRAWPTGDALLSVPRQRADRAGEKLEAATRRQVSAWRARLDVSRAKLARHTPVAELVRQQGRFGALAQRFDGLAPGLAAVRRRNVRDLADRARRAPAARPRARVAEGRRRAGAGLARADRALTAQVKARRARLDQYEQLRQSLGYKQVLARGFALVLKDGGPIKRATEVSPGAALEIRFADGSVSAHADGARSPRKGTKEGGPDQGSLF